MEFGFKYAVFSQWNSHSYRKTRITVVMVVRQTGQQVPPSAATLLAQLSQKCACPYGTNANPSRGATIRQTWQRSVSVSAASETEVVVAVEVNADVAVVSCVTSSYCYCRCPQHDRGYKIL